MPTISVTCTWAVQIALMSSLCLMPRAADADPPPADACAVFTASQVNAVLGIAVSEGRHPISSSLLLCGWAPTGPQSEGRKLSVSLMTERAFEIGKAPMQGLVKTPVAGVGDDAYYVTGGSLGTELCVKKGSAYVRIRVVGFSAAKEKQLEKTLALLIPGEL